MASAQSHQHATAEFSDLKGIRVLLADGDEELLNDYQRFLLENGAVVARATGGVDCLDQLRVFRPTLLVLEPELPWGGGAAVLSRMHEDPNLPKVPVIVVTAGRDLFQLREILRFPLYDLVVKPISPRQLASKIRWIATLTSHAGHVAWPPRPQAGGRD